MLDAIQCLFQFDIIHCFPNEALDSQPFTIDEMIENILLECLLDHGKHGFNGIKLWRVWYVEDRNDI